MREMAVYARQPKTLYFLYRRSQPGGALAASGSGAKTQFYRTLIKAATFCTGNHHGIYDAFYMFG